MPALLDEVVVGHQQYQRAANQNPTFRRAFAEVFRRRSMLFVGSGLAESYFINLISEIILNFGPSPHPHFAMFSQNELKDIDPEFLEIRLGITAVDYGQDHDRLPDALAEISAATQYSDLEHALSTPRPLAMCYGMPRGSGPAAKPKMVECSLRFAHLGKPGPGECAVLSVGLAPTDNGFQPKLGSQARSFFAAHYPDLREFGPGNAKPVARRLLRVVGAGQELPVFLLGAREITDTRADRRSLSAISLATVEALAIIEQLQEFRTVSMGLLAAGDRSFAHPMFAFIAQFSGIRRFTLEQSPPPSDDGLNLIEVRIVDPSVISPILEGRLPIQELLSSDTIRVLVRVYDHSSHSEAYTVSVSSEATVEQVLAPYGLSRDDIDIQVSPLPHPLFAEPLKAPVFPTMTIEVSPRAATRSS